MFCLHHFLGVALDYVCEIRLLVCIHSIQKVLEICTQGTWYSVVPLGVIDLKDVVFENNAASSAVPWLSSLVAINLYRQPSVAGLVMIMMMMMMRVERIPAKSRLFVRYSQDDVIKRVGVRTLLLLPSLPIRTQAASSWWSTMSLRHSDEHRHVLLQQEHLTIIRSHQPWLITYRPECTPS